MSSVFLWVAMPALFTSTSRRPKVSTVFLNSAMMASSLVRSAGSGSASPPLALMPAATSSSSSARHQHGLRALGGEQLGDAAADAVAGAGDDRDLALELSGHPVLPFAQMPLLTKGPLSA